MVLLTTQLSSAKRLPLSGVVKIPEPAPPDHENMLNGQLQNTVLTLPHDAERLLTLLFTGQPALSKRRLLSQVGEEAYGSHFYALAPTPSGKEELFQFSLKDYKVTAKPYRKLVTLDSRDTLVDHLHNTFWDSNKVVKGGNVADDGNDGNGNLEYQDQEMAESTLIGEQGQSKTKRSLRLPRSPVTSRGFLEMFPGLYRFGLDEGQGERPFHIPTGYGGSEASFNPRATNNHEQYLQEDQWSTHTTLYPLQHRNSLQTRDGRGNILSQSTVRDRESFRSGGYAHVTLGSEYDTKNAFQENLRKHVSQIKVSQKNTLQNKKRDLSREHVTLGENLDNGSSQKASHYRSTAPEETSVYNRPTLGNALMRMIIRGEERWDKSVRSNFGQQFEPLSQDELISLTSQHNVPVAVSEQVLAVSPVDDKPSEYDHIVGSVPPSGDLYSSVVEGALVLDTGDQQKFWLGADSGLLHENVFSRPDDHNGFSPIPEHHVGLRIFKRSAGTGGLRKGGVPQLLKHMQEGSESHMSGTLAKRSPLSHGYVAGIGAGVDHHQNHDHLAAAATGSALHQAHHHDTLPPAVVLSSEHHHTADAAHHLVAKSETTVGGSAGGAGGGRGPNHEEPGPGTLVVLHPQHPLLAAPADDDAIHVIAAVPFAVAHHHELHHEADHVLSKSTTLTLAQHETDPHVLSKTTTVTTVTQHDNSPLLVVHAADAPVVLLHHPPASQSSTSTTTVHKPPGSHNLLRVPLGGFGVGVTFGGAGAGHGFYAAG